MTIIGNYPQKKLLGIVMQRSGLYSLFLHFSAGWCGEIRDVIFSDNGSVTVVYRVTIRGSDGEVNFLTEMSDRVILP